MKTTHFKNIFLVSISLILLASCARQNAGLIKQTYQDMTGHYNTYFNANELYKETVKSVEENRNDDYTQILPLYAYGTQEDTKAKDADFQTAQEKATTSIQLHKISNWADDAFLLVGKTYYMQGNNENAIESFRYITSNYKEGVDGRSDKKIKKQKYSKKRNAKAKKQDKKDLEALKDGKDIRPSDGFLKHDPARSQALVWLVKAFTSNEQYTEADAVLTFIRDDRDFHKNYDKDVELANAFMYLEQEKYPKAIEHIEAALELIKKQKKKNRYQFVLAQLYNETGNSTLAADYFKKSMKANADYEMIFYAKMNLIKMSRDGGYDKDDAEKLIAQMLRDKKNRNFYDQLYYEKALIALDNDEREDAKDYLAQSIETSVDNSTQKANSYILLADLNYEEEMYTNAQALYDSSLALINIDFENYYEIENRSIVLTDLVEQLNIINTNDSLLVIASMPQKEREDYLYKLAVDLIEQEDKDKLSKQTLTSTSTTTSTDKGAWYFYSESLRSKGLKKFKSQWGEATLEDDWRRADKSSASYASNEDTTGVNTVDDSDFFGRITEKYEAMLAEVPTTDTAKQAFHTEIEDAHFEAAMIYKSGLDNLPKSIQTLEQLLSRYKDSDYEAESFYNLYLMYAKLENKPKSDKYKNLLLGEYKDSDYAKIIKDPSYLEALTAQGDEAIKYYDDTYILYTTAQYDKVLARCANATTQFPKNNLQAKFDLLKAMATGGNKEREEYINSLQYVVDTHANTEEQVKAEEMLAYLRGEVKETTPKNLKLDKVNKSLEIKKKDVTEIEENDDNGLKLKLGNKEIGIGKKDKNQVEKIDIGE